MYGPPLSPGGIVRTLLRAANRLPGIVAGSAVFLFSLTASAQARGADNATSPGKTSTNNPTGARIARAFAAGWREECVRRRIQLVIDALQSIGGTPTATLRGANASGDPRGTVPCTFSTPDTHTATIAFTVAKGCGAVRLDGSTTCSRTHFCQPISTEVRVDGNDGE